MIIKSMKIDIAQTTYEKKRNYDFNFPADITIIMYVKSS